MRKSVTQCAGLAIALAAMAGAAHAAERVELRNGFTMTCDHHAQVDGQVRLYLSAGEDNYIALEPDEIAGYQTVAEVATGTVTGTVTGTGTGAGQPADAQKKTPVKLSPADLREMLNRAGTAHNLDVDLLASVVKAESDGQAHAVSRAGARGLMQLMPKTATQLGVKDSFNASDNVRGGSEYLDELLKRYHENMALALAAYNAGPEAVDRFHGVPPYGETRAYVARVIHEFNRRVRAREAVARRMAAGGQGGY